MADKEIPQWAWERLVQLEHEAGGTLITPARGFPLNAAFARYIAEHEEPLVDPKQHAINELVELLAPVLTHHQGMLANSREERFRQALKALIEIAKEQGR